MTYRPNFNDPRVRRRMITAVEWAETTLSSDSAREVSAFTLNSVFGAKTQNIRDWLAPRILIREGGYSEGKCYSYRLNVIGVKALRKLLQAEGIIPAHRLEVYGREFATELESGIFSYRDATNDHRRHHRLHGVRRVEKKRFWLKHGYTYDYDISTSGPTILSQMAIGAHIPVIRDYLTNKKSIRVALAARLGVTVQEAKQVITALFNGARIVPHRSCAIFDKLNGDREALAKLKSDEWVQSLLADVKTMWECIRDIHFQKTGEKLKRAELWSIYYKQERAVMDAALASVKTGSKVFIEHDGFRSDVKQDAESLSTAVYQKTGFSITFDEIDYSVEEEEITLTSNQQGIMLYQVPETGFLESDTATIRHKIEARRSGFSTEIVH